MALDALTPENVAGYVLPAEAAVAHLARVAFDEAEAIALGYGQRPPAPIDAPPGDAAAFGADGRFLGVVAAVGGEWRARKMVSEAD